MKDLSRLDWNLMPALDALLAERNVSRAADRLGVGQPSMSSSLARLRRHFGDDLLRRHGQTYELTPLAERLAPLARSAVETTLGALTSATWFDPATSTRTFTIAASDYVQVVLGAPLFVALAQRAPHTRMELVSPYPAGNFKENADVVNRTDGWLAPREMLPGRPCGGLLSDRWVCVADQQHPTVGDELTLDDLRQLAWVAPTIRGELLRFHLDGLASLGIEPSIAATTEYFTSIPLLVAGTDRIGLMQGRLAHKTADLAGVKVLECPWPVQALKLTFWWHPTRDADPAHAWLRDLIAELMADLESVLD